jgi:hypothetical protein
MEEIATDASAMTLPSGAWIAAALKARSGTPTALNATP